MYDWSEATRWETCVSRARRQAGKGGRIIRWYGQRGGSVCNEVAIWERRESSKQGGWDGI